MPKLLISGWDLKEDSSASVLMSIAHYFNSNPVSFSKCNKALDISTIWLDTWSNEREIMMQDRRAKGVRQEETHGKFNLITGSTSRVCSIDM